MAREVKRFAITVPAGTSQAAPITQPTTFEPRIVRRIEWVFPPGCNGLVGILFSMNQIPVIPLPSGTFIIESAVTGGYDVTGQPDSGAWQVTAFNTGANPHTIQVSYHADLIEPREPDFTLLDQIDLGSMSAQLGTGYL